MEKLLVIICFSFMTLNNIRASNHFDLSEKDGYPVANFAIAANVSTRGGILGGVLRNPGELGKWLRYQGGGKFVFRKGRNEVNDNEFAEVKVDRRWPFVKIKGSDPRLGSLKFSSCIWAPVGLDDLTTSSLPVVQIAIKVANNGKKTSKFSIDWELEELFKENVSSYQSDLLNGVRADDRIAAFVGEAKWNSKRKVLEAEIKLVPGEERELRFLLVLHDEKWVSANKFSGADEVSDYVAKNWKMLLEKTQTLEKRLLSTGDEKLDEYLRWYIIPAIILTKCTSNNEILTMGYRELNQRDSYWTSWIHLVLWPKVERRMIEESAAAQKENGKIPTCILPKIERHDDIDINAYFVLRALRFVRYYKDEGFGRQVWPAVVKAVDWLISRDLSGKGLPHQKSFWGDWKDVPGVTGRKYSPHASLLYLAVLDRATQFARQIGDNSVAERFQTAYAKGYEFINWSDKDGGLWNGKFYRQVWYDNREDNKILQDQVIGILLGVVNKERSQSIFNSLEDNKCAYGVRETWPYYPASFGYEPGNYHNGGVWPWLNYVDAWARINFGLKEDGINLIKTVAFSDLEAENDWLANEYIDAETGAGKGPSIQGWNASLFGAIYFGLIEKSEVP